MTKEEAKAKQDDLAKHYDLAFWYGVRCEKCCGVYPRLETAGHWSADDVYYQCEVCGKRTKGFLMPHLAEQAWNNHEYKDETTQLSWI